MKKCAIAMAGAVVLCLALTGCSFQDLMLYLYGGDDFVAEDKAPAYVLYEGENGVTVVYDGNFWMAPTMVQADTISLTAGGSNDTTVVLLQVSDQYTDFLAQSGQELESETGTVKYDYQLTVPDATTTAVRYDCGSYQTIFAQIDYDTGDTVYVTAATKRADETSIATLLQAAYPTGATPESAKVLLQDAKMAQGEDGRQNSYA